MATLRDISARHSRYQDSLLYTFESHLREIILRSQALVASRLQRRLKITDGVIERTPANYRAMRQVDKMLVQAMDEMGYSRLVTAFTGEFANTLPFLDETLQYLSDQLKTPLPMPNLKADPVLDTYRLTAADAIDSAVSGVAGSVMQRSMLSVGGLRFESLLEMLVDRFETTIARARTLADTAMSTFYRTATDRAFQKIADDLPEQKLRFRYSGPVDKLERPFCRHLTDVAKAYTREQIDRMDNRMLPNVWLTGGGWNCRHSWLLDISGLEIRAAEAA